MANKIVSYLKKYYSKMDRSIITYSICVFIAAGLWGLNKLNREYTTEISYPVKYTDFPKDKYIVNTPPQEIVIEVKAKGFVLLRHQISHAFLPITLSLNSAQTSKQPQNKEIQEYALKLNDIREKIAGQLSSSIKLISIDPEEIHLAFSKATSKKVKISPLVKYSMKKGYILKDAITCIPDSVEINGSAALLDTIREIRTSMWHAGEIHKNKTSDIELLYPSGVHADIKSVNATVEVERFTEAKRSIPIIPLNVPDSLRIKLFPENVEITYEVGLSRYDFINDKDFRFIAVYDPKDGSSYLQVKADMLSPFIQNLRFTPQKIEFILEKK
ncbi:YbbR-like domain-containing protein [Odoribacter sp. OttesenSCG-928-J03]|nr:YbbR-like domain-containing protein [Odoribacter sp. OttesenSCG-928-J03]